MTRLETSAWSPAGGSLCVFVLAVALNRLPWQVAFTAALVAVAAWAWTATPVVGAAIGLIGWACVTGFDVHRLGHLTITGEDDIVRAAALMLTGLVIPCARAATGATRRRRRADPLWADFHEHHFTRALDRAGHDRPPVSRAARAERLRPADETEERTDGRRGPDLRRGRRQRGR